MPGTSNYLGATPAGRRTLGPEGDSCKFLITRPPSLQHVRQAFWQFDCERHFFAELPTFLFGGSRPRSVPGRSPVDFI